MSKSFTQEEIDQRLISEIEQVKELGERIGYGQMMELASALWRKSLKNSGYPETGAFITTIQMMIREEELSHHHDSMQLYDKLIKKYDK